MTRFPVGLAALNATQFLGAMNDNILKLLIIFCLIQTQGSQRAGTVDRHCRSSLCIAFLLFCSAVRLSGGSLQQAL